MGCKTIFTFSFQVTLTFDFLTLNLTLPFTRVRFMFRLNLKFSQLSYFEKIGGTTGQTDRQTDGRTSHNA